MAGAVSVGKDFPPEFTTWEPMSIELRSLWCKKMLAHPPCHLGNAVGSLITQTTNTRGWHTSSDYIQVAKEFDALGFTPDEFGVLNDAVKADKRSRGVRSYGTVGAGATIVSPSVRNSMITLDGFEQTGYSIRLQASDWVDYLEKVRAGGSPQELVDEILAPHWGEPREPSSSEPPSRRGQPPVEIAID